MARIGLGGPRGRLQPASPRALPHLGIGHVVLERGHLLGLGIARPQAPCGPRKSGMPDSVEMPAPVSTTTRRAASIQVRAATERLSSGVKPSLARSARKHLHPLAIDR